MNPIFPVTIHENIEAVTAHLAAQGLMTPRLLPTRRASCAWTWVRRGVWRLWTHVDGVSFDVIRDTGQAQAAGALVGRFHRALDASITPSSGCAWGCTTPPAPARLRDGVSAEATAATACTPGGRAGGGHPGGGGQPAAAAGAARPRLPRRPEVQQHPVRRDRGAAAEQPMCLIDLDTLGPMPLAFELGDAWRSWCNRNGENNPVAALDLEMFRASLEGYRAGPGPPAERGRAAGAAAGAGLGQRRAGRAVRRRRPVRELLRLGPQALRRPGRAQPGPRPRPVHPAPGGGRLPPRARPPAGAGPHLNPVPPLVPAGHRAGVGARHPLPGSRGEGAGPSFAKYRIMNAAVERLATGMRWCEGPVWFGDGRYLLWSDIPNNRIMRWDEATGTVAEFRRPSSFANGNTRDRQAAC